jgi:2-polyprenyl-3-methyl-5-hydroxy-6-metoxy-1,4-benzoquinol methylase
MNRSRLQLITVNQIEERPPVWSFLKKIRDSLNGFFNEENYNLVNNKDENYLTRIDYIKNSPENHAIAGLIIENLYPGIKVLEIGCGSGLLYQHLYKLPVQYSGIDTSAKDIESANFKFKDSGKPFFLTRDFNEFSTTNKYDIIVINDDLISYKASYIKHLLLKAVSLLKDDDSVIIIPLPKQFKSWKVWRKTKFFPFPYIDISVRNNITGMFYNIKAYKGLK